MNGSARLRLQFAGQLFVCLAVALTGLPAAAQQAVIEEVIVTAQKREQSILDVPIAVAAYDSETLQRAGVNDIRDLQQISPSLFLTSTQSEAAGTTGWARLVCRLPLDGGARGDDSCRALVAE